MFRPSETEANVFLDQHLKLSQTPQKNPMLKSGFDLVLDFLFALPVMG
jgi:hypothetical protein